MHRTGGVTALITRQESEMFPVVGLVAYDREVVGSGLPSIARVSLLCLHGRSRRVGEVRSVCDVVSPRGEYPEKRNPPAWQPRGRIVDGR